MQCDHSYLPLLSGHLDGSNSETEEKRLEKHLKSCRHCRELLQSMEEADLLLVQSIFEPPADLTARIMRAVEQEPKKKKSRKRYYFSTALAGLAAAAVLCFALLGDNLPLLPEKANSSAPEVRVADEADLPSPAEAEEQLQSPDSFATDEENALLLDTAQDSAPEELASEQIAALESTVSSTQTHTQPTETAPPGAVADPEPTNQADPSSDFEPPTLPALETEASDTSTHNYSSTFGYRAPISGKDTSASGVPTLVIWDASADELSLPFGAQKKEFSALRENDSTSLYQQFASALSLLRKPTSLSGSRIYLAFTSEIYSITYDELQELLNRCVQKYELAFYLPKEIGDLSNCQLILIDAAQTSGKVTSGKATE